MGSVAKIIKNERNPREKEAFTADQLASLRGPSRPTASWNRSSFNPTTTTWYLLLEGERRWTVAQELKIKEIPVVIIDRLDEHDQVVVMFNVHTQRKGWEKAEELRAIQELRDRNGQLADDDLARELGISPPPCGTGFRSWPSARRIPPSSGR